MISINKILKVHPNISTSELANLSNLLFKIFFFIFILSLAGLTIKKSHYYQQNYEDLVVSSVSHSVNSLNAWLNQQRQLIYNLAQSDAIINYLTDPNDVTNAQSAYYRLTNLKAFSPSFTNALVIINTRALPTHTPLIAVNNHQDTFTLHGNLSLLMDTSNPESNYGIFKPGANVDTLLYAPHINKSERNFFIGKLEVTTNRISFPLIQLVYNSDGELLGAVIFNVDLQSFVASMNAITLGETGNSIITDKKGLFISPYIKSNLLIDEPEVFKIKNWFYQNLKHINLDQTTNTLQRIFINKEAHIFYAKKLTSFYTIDSPLYIIFVQDFREAFKPAFFDFLWSDLILMIIFAMGGGLVIFFLYEQYRSSFEMEKLYNRKNYNDLVQLSLVDGLTGLYNRTFFRQHRDEMEVFEGSVGMIVIDIDGLKIINDTFGHEQGDALIRMCASIIKGSLPKMKIARIGGDEFMSFLPNYNAEQVKIVVNRLRDNIRLINKKGHDLPLPISFSIGWASMVGPYTTNELFREADALLYSNKSEQSSLLRSRILKHFSHMLIQVDATTTNHYLEILRIAHSIALKANETEPVDFTNLKLLVRYHNIGLISHDKSAQTLTNHIQTGYRIALYLPKLTPIASLILTHEEIYCGTGPLAFKTHEIPIECRILTISLLFISRYHGSCYRNSALALSSIKRDSGRLFDPRLVEILSDIINAEHALEVGEN